MRTHLFDILPPAEVVPAIFLTGHSLNPRSWLALTRQSIFFTTAAYADKSMFPTPATASVQLFDDNPSNIEPWTLDVGEVTLEQVKRLQKIAICMLLLFFVLLTFALAYSTVRLVSCCPPTCRRRPRCAFASKTQAT